MKKIVIVILALVLSAFLYLSRPQNKLVGSWESEDGWSLSINETHFDINGRSLPYEYSKDGLLVLDSGIFGPIKGRWLRQNKELHLNLYGKNFIFYSA